MWVKSKELAFKLIPKPAKKLKLDEKIDVEKQTFIDEGFYIFGGKDTNGVLLNDLWLVQPSYKKNGHQISQKDYNYLGDKGKLYINAKKITKFKG